MPRVLVPTTVTRKNLVLNPSFEVDTSGWYLDADYTRVNTDSYSGTWSIKQVSTTNYANFTTSNDATGLAVVPNTMYVASFYYKMAITSGSGVNVQINGGSAYGTTLVAVGLSSNAAAWTSLIMYFYSGSNTKVYFRISNNNGNCVAYYDAFQLEIGTQATKYFDGSFGSASWEGTANNSISDWIGRYPISGRTSVT
jgi:hypothetical protein